MFRELYHLLKSDNYYNLSPDIEILKGWFGKPITLKDKIEKTKRKYKFKL